MTYCTVRAFLTIAQYMKYNFFTFFPYSTDPIYHSYFILFLFFTSSTTAPAHPLSPPLPPLFFPFSTLFFSTYYFDIKSITRILFYYFRHFRRLGPFATVSTDTYVRERVHVLTNIFLSLFLPFYLLLLSVSISTLSLFSTITIFKTNHIFFFFFPSFIINFFFITICEFSLISYYFTLFSTYFNILGSIFFSILRIFFIFY